jgi:hypothetical protein
MSVIATLIEPHRVTRVFFDCRDTAANPADQRRIERAIQRSFSLPQADDDAEESLPLAA